jgi:hypothetical protein
LRQCHTVMLLKYFTNFVCDSEDTFRRQTETS